MEEDAKWRRVIPLSARPIASFPSSLGVYIADVSASEAESLSLGPGDSRGLEDVVCAMVR